MSISNESNKLAFRPFHITIGAAAKGSFDLQEEMRMVKAAVLYGDKAKMCSLVAAVSQMSLALTELSSVQQVQFLQDTIPHLPRGNTPQLKMALAVYRLLAQKKNRTSAEEAEMAKIQARLAPSWDKMKKNLLAQVDLPAMRDLDYAVQAGVLELENLSDDSGASEAMVLRFFDTVQTAVSDGTTYPLFDESVAKIVSNAIEEGKIKVSEQGVARGREASLAADLISRLPLFDQATMVEVLDIRKELERPLVRFRRGIIDFADTIKTASWDKEFEYEVERIFRHDVEPVILEIEEAVQQNRYLLSLMRKGADKTTAASASAFVASAGAHLKFLLAQPDQFSLWASQVFAATGVGATVILGTQGYIAWKEQQEKRQKIEQNTLFFLYQAREKLRKKTKKKGK